MGKGILGMSTLEHLQTPKRKLCRFPESLLKHHVSFIHPFSHSMWKQIDWEAKSSRPCRYPLPTWIASSRRKNPYHNLCRTQTWPTQSNDEIQRVAQESNDINPSPSSTSPQTLLALPAARFSKLWPQSSFLPSPDPYPPTSLSCSLQCCSSLGTLGCIFV